MVSLKCIKAYKGVKAMAQCPPESGRHLRLTESKADSHNKHGLLAITSRARADVYMRDLSGKAAQVA